MTPPIALVLLAAGASTRLAEPKALARLRPGAGGLAIDLLLAAGRALGDEHPLVVTGADHRAIHAHLAQRCEVLANAAWAEGRTGGILRAAAARAGRDLCVAPVDHPLVPAAVFAALARTWSRAGAPARGWLAPCVRVGSATHFGHPVVLGRALVEELKNFPPDRPLSALRPAADPLLACRTRVRAILDDLDTPRDLARLRAHLAEGAGEASE